MPEEPEPLYIQVARAIGWTDLKLLSAQEDLWFGARPGSPDSRLKSYVPRYDQEWLVTGPLIERYKINLYAHGTAWPWEAHFREQLTDPDHPEYNPHPLHVVGGGSTALLAVCEALVAALTVLTPKTQVAHTSTE